MKTEKQREPGPPAASAGCAPRPWLPVMSRRGSNNGNNATISCMQTSAATITKAASATAASQRKHNNYIELPHRI